MRRCRIALLVVVTSLFSIAAFAQTTSSLRGRIVDAQGGILPGVLMQLVSAQTAFERNVTTDETGIYQFPQIPPGIYELMAKLEGFAEVTQKITLQVNTPPTLDVKMDLAGLSEAVAERFAAVGEFLLPAPEGADPIVAGIIRSGAKYSAVEAYRARYRLEALKRDAAKEWAAIDVMLLPTAGTIYTRDQIAADPLRLNTTLGYYTNFVNLMDLAAVAVPAGFRGDGLPFGVSIIGPAFSDEALLGLAARMTDAVHTAPAAPGCVSLAVVGAHLTGQPLNHQLTDRGARLVRSTRTSKHYRLFALRDTAPAKPGLLRDERFAGDGIAVELWSVPQHQFGSFVAAVPPPLAIGSIQLASGAWVKGFVCEPRGLADALEITEFGGWKNFVARETVGAKK